MDNDRTVRVGDTGTLQSDPHRPRVGEEEDPGPHLDPQGREGGDEGHDHVRVHQTLT